MVDITVRVNGATHTGSVEARQFIDDLGGTGEYRDS